MPSGTKIREIKKIKSYRKVIIQHLCLDTFKTTFIIFVQEILAINEYHELRRAQDADKKKKRPNTSTTPAAAGKPATNPLASSVEFSANEQRLQNMTRSTWKLPFKDTALPISKAAIKEEFRRLDIVGENRLTILNLRSALELREVRESDAVIRDWFREHDRGGKGYIDFKDYQAIYEHHNGNSSSTGGAKHASAQQQQGTSLSDPNNGISASPIDRKRANEERLGILRKAFERYDVDGDGFISSEDLRTAFTAQGKAFTTPDLKTWVQTRDVSGTGAVSFEDFCLHYK